MPDDVLIRGLVDSAMRRYMNDLVSIDDAMTEATTAGYLLGRDIALIGIMNMLDDNVTPTKAHILNLLLEKL